MSLREDLALARRLWGSILQVVRARLPDDLDPADLDVFDRREGKAMVQLLLEEVVPLIRSSGPGPRPSLPAGPPETWAPSQRTVINLAAMRLLARGGALSPEERRVVGGYSGWGGLSLRKVAEQFPAGFPVPEARGLVHEYYTPERVWRAVADLLLRFVPQLQQAQGRIRALEPSAGIGRAIRAWTASGWPEVDWTAVEASAVSSRLLRAVSPATVHEGFFESYVAEHPRERFDLVVSNPPYGPRGEAMEQDSHPAYKTKRASLYFLYRSLDLLRPGGIAAYIIPTGWLTGTSPEMRKARERVLMRHHLLGAFRLPSQAPEGGSVADVVYDQFVTDLLLFESRGGQLTRVPDADLAILEGSYYELNPAQVLGREVGKTSEGWEPGQPVARRGYQVVGRFEGFPASWQPRPMTVGELADLQVDRQVKARGGIAREDQTAAVGEMSETHQSAVRLGDRVDAFLAQVARQELAAVDTWPELHRDLLAWRQRHGDPLDDQGLRELAARRVVGAQRFLAAWTRQGLIEGLRQAPVMQAPRYTGAWTVPAIVDWLYAQRGGRLTVSEVVQWTQDQRRPLRSGQVLAEAAGYCIDGEDLVADADYYSGLLWPKLDRATARGQGDDFVAEIARRQAERLRELIGWRSGPSILQELLPIDSWLPLDLVGEWLAAATGMSVTLERKDGVLLPEGVVYALLDNTDKHRTPGMNRDGLSFIGWANTDKGLWNPERRKVDDPETGKEKLEPIDDARRNQMADWMKHWTSWLQERPEYVDRIEAVYNRQLRGYIEPVYPSTPIEVARWSSAIRLHDYQNQGGHKLLRNRCGLLAFDVGLGKTYTGLKTLARARQEGWARRPVVLVPNSIVWKWHRDFAKVLPDYRVLVIGSERTIAQRGRRKGRVVAAPDSPEARARKWSQFQAGEADVVLLTYSALARTQMSPDIVNTYVQGTISLRRSIVMALEAADEEAEAAGKKKRLPPTERKAADIQERVRAWVAELLAPPKGWVYDPGIEWHSLGIDFLMVDEAQNFKNLLFSEREGGERTAAKRSWALDFRCASVRQHTGGTGVFLLSATPAKNSPTEFYNLLHLVRPELWHQAGIDNHEGYLTRFGRFARKQVLDPGGQKLVERDVVVGFKNIDELRDVVNRWSQFRVAEDVGLKLPAVEVKQHTVQTTPAMRDALAEAYSELADIEDKLKALGGRIGTDPVAARAAKALVQKKQGVALRIYLIYLHPDLPGIGSDQQTILKSDSTDAPKLVEAAREIIATSEQVCPRPDATERWCMDCGHIVFCDNIAVHYWMRRLLEQGGIPKERIAILNAIEAKDTELRQQIVERFNGVGSPGDEDYIEPDIDIVIANAVAYEGMDLQRRTCAIHHLDVPWEPATLQQRNGRGVRQGNTFAKVTIHFYFVEFSNEPWKVQRIERKRGWMAELVAGQRRKTNTTMEVELDEADAEEMALAHAPPEVRERIQRARKEQEAQVREAKRIEAQRAANKDLTQANALWRRVARETEPLRQAELRREAEEATQRALRYPVDLWPPGVPWHAQAELVRTHELFIPARGLPLAPGDRIKVQGQDLYEVGSMGTRELEQRGGKAPKLVRGVWLRMFGLVEALDRHLLLEDQDTLLDGSAIVLIPSEPADDLQAQMPEIQRMYGTGAVVHPSYWLHRNWHRLSPTTQERWWKAVASEWTNVKAPAGPYPSHNDKELRIPVDQRGALLVIEMDGARSVPDGGRVIPPTPSGWTAFQALAETSDLTWGQLNAIARFWWRRGWPKRASTSTPAAEQAA